MDYHYGFKFTELLNHPEINLIEKRMKSVVQICYKGTMRNYFLGTGFFLFKDPPILLTPFHVLMKFIKGSRLKKGVYFRLNYNDELFKEKETNIYLFEPKEKIFFNKEEDLSLIILSNALTCEIESLSSSISKVLPPECTAGIVPNMFSSYKVDSNISMIHHPSEECKHIATAYNKYRMVHVNWNDLLEGRFIERSDKIVGKLRKGLRFVYWALVQGNKPIFVRCTDHGSSGSPLFDNQWKLIGMHIQGSRVRTQNGRNLYCLYGVGIPSNIIINHIQEFF